MENISMSSAGSAAIRNGFHIRTDGRTVEELVCTVLDHIGA